MAIKNLPTKPTAIITRLGRKPTQTKDIIFEHAKSKINMPLPVNAISYYEDGRLSYISINLPELERIVDENTVVCEQILFFNNDDVDITLTYVD